MNTPELPAYADLLIKMRPSQFAGRVRRAVPPRIMAAGLRLEPPPGWSPVASGLGLDDAPQSGPTPPPHLDATFRFVGRERAFCNGRPFWEPGDDGLLFAFHVHEFRELARFAAESPNGPGWDFWSEVLRSWLEHCSAVDVPAWHPYPLSGRLLAWCAALSAAPSELPGTLTARMRESAWLQTRYLRRCVERDIGGNHVLRNAVALAVAATCFESGPLRTYADTLLQRELRRQILPDGGHEERSPAYHRAILSDLRALETVDDRATGRPRAWLTQVIRSMEEWQAALVGPDGALPLLNDAWEGPALQRRKEDPITVLPSTGYVVLRHGGDQAVLDVAPLAPAHLPAHAHADALSFVLWADGEPIVVDPGTFTYAGRERNAFRGTAAHNTVTVDDEDQCRFWGPFRASFLPRVQLVDIRRTEGVVLVRARHDGYRRLADPVVHERLFAWLPGDGLVVVDSLECERPHAATTRLHFAPARTGPLRVEPLGDGVAIAEQTGRVSPFLGTSVPAAVLEQTLHAEPGRAFGWSLLRPGASARLERDALRLNLRDGRVVEVPLPRGDR